MIIPILFNVVSLLTLPHQIGGNRNALNNRLTRIKESLETVISIAICRQSLETVISIAIYRPTGDKWQSKSLFSIAICRQSLETVISIAIYRPTGDKWQSKSLFLTILIYVFYCRLSCVVTVLV